MAGRIAVNLLAGAAFVAAGVIDHSLKPRQTTNLTIDQCPGYTASNVQYSGNRTVSADLSLAGTACDTYGIDLTNLRLLVEYQTGTYFMLCRTLNANTQSSTPTRQNIRCC